MPEPLLQTERLTRSFGSLTAVNAVLRNCSMRRPNGWLSVRRRLSSLTTSRSL